MCVCCADLLTYHMYCRLYIVFTTAVILLRSWTNHKKLNVFPFNPTDRNKRLFLLNWWYYSLTIIIIRKSKAEQIYYNTIVIIWNWWFNMRLQITYSNENQIRLTGLSLNSSGQYKCEVSTGPPFFATNYKQTNLTVIGKPLYN